MFAPNADFGLDCPTHQIIEGARERTEADVIKVHVVIEWALLESPTMPETHRDSKTL
jgi:hypothetical protein